MSEGAEREAGRVAAAGVPLHPPTRPGPIVFEDPSRTWAPFIGALLLGLCGLGMLQHVFSFATMFVDWESLLPGMYVETQAELMAEYRVEFMTLYVTAILLGFLVGAGSILLMMRKPISIFLLIMWAILRVPHAVAGAWLGSKAAAQSMSMVPAGAAGPPPGFAQAMGSVTFVVSLVPPLILPAFVVIWFALGWTRRQTRHWPPKRGVISL